MVSSAIWYRIGRVICRIYYKSWHRLKSVGVDKFPKTGGVILVCNHISHLDPPAVGSAARRLVRFVAKEELFRQPFLRWYFKMLGIIPLKRGGGGRVMLGEAAKAVEGGDVVLLFPEGTRSRSGTPGRFRTGMLILAAMTGAPVLPARISGSYDSMPPGVKLIMPCKIQVAFGEPIQWEPDELDTNNREQMAREAAKVRDAVIALPGWQPRKVKVPAEGTDKTSE